MLGESCGFFFAQLRSLLLVRIFDFTNFLLFLRFFALLPYGRSGRLCWRFGWGFCSSPLRERLTGGGLDSPRRDFNFDQMDPVNYDMVVNTGSLGLEAATETILAAFHQRFKE